MDGGAVTLTQPPLRGGGHGEGVGGAFQVSKEHPGDSVLLDKGSSELLSSQGQWRLPLALDKQN